MVVLNLALFFRSVPETSVPTMVTSATESLFTSLTNSENVRSSGLSADDCRTTAHTNRVRTTMSTQKMIFLTAEFKAPLSSFSPQP